MAEFVGPPPVAFTYGIPWRPVPRPLLADDEVAHWEIGTIVPVIECQAPPSLDPEMERDA